MKTTQSLFRQSTIEWLEEARSTARGLLLTRPYITINDVLTICPRPQYVHRNIVGSVFKNGDFRVVGFTKSNSRLAKGRIICQWGLKHTPSPRKIRNKLQALRRNDED